MWGFKTNFLFTLAKDFLVEVFFRLQQLPCGGMEPFMELNLDSTQTPCCYIQTVLYLLFSYSEGDSLSENISDLKLTDILPANKKASTWDVAINSNIMFKQETENRCALQKTYIEVHTSGMIQSF